MTSTLPHSTTSEAPPDRAAAIRRFLDSLQLPHRRLHPEELESVAVATAERPELWADLVVDSPDERWWIVLHRTPAFEIRLLSWEFDQSSGWHDHGGSSGGFVVTEGALDEHFRGADFVTVEHRRLGPQGHGCFGPEHVHDVAFDEGAPAVSVHAYSPPLTQLTMYDVTPFGFVVREVVPDDRRNI